MRRYLSAGVLLEAGKRGFLPALHLGSQTYGASGAVSEEELCYAEAVKAGA